MKCTRHTLSLLALGLAGLSLSTSLNADVRITTQVQAISGVVQALPNITQTAASFSFDLSKTQTLDMLKGLRSVRVGSQINIRTSNQPSYTYKVDLLHSSQDTLEIRAHFPADPDKKIVFGLNPEGVSGFLELPDGSIHALGYVDGKQIAGTAGDHWMADKLAAHAMQERKAEPHETAPVKGALPIHIDLPLLAGMNAGDQTNMQLPGVGVARVVMDRVVLTQETLTWVGHLADFGDSYPVLITYSAETIEGSALTPQGEVILSGGYAYNPQLAGLVNAKHEGENCAMEHAAGHVAEATASSSGAVKAASSGTTDSNGKTLDVLVYYSPGMEAQFGSLTAVATRVDALIAAANQAYNAGKLGYTMRRVGLKKIVTSDLTSNNDTLSRFYAGSGEFAGVKAERNAMGADLVTLIRPLRTAQHVSCGVAYVGGYGGGNLAAYGDQMVSVISDGKDINGSNTYCDTMTLAHETGHNLGLMHDRATVASQGGGSGVKPYAFGYAKSKTWGTIMSYTSPVQYRFSNPIDNTCPGNVPCGISSTLPTSADNVLALTYSLPIVSTFRNAGTTAETRYTVSGIVTLDGKAVAGANLTPSIATVSCSASGSTGMYSCQAVKGTSFTLTPGLTLSNGAKVTWTPSSATINAIAANSTANFAGKSSAASYTLSGKILLDGKPVSSTTVKVTGSGASCGASNSLGIFSCAVTPGSSITLTPNVAVPTGSKITWSPASTSFTQLAANISSVNFSGATSKLSRSITGKVSVYANGVLKTLAGVSLKPSVAGVTCGVTNSSGNFSCSASNMAAFTLLPTYSKTGYTFRWMGASLPANINTDINYVGTATCPKAGCNL